MPDDPPGLPARLLFAPLHAAEAAPESDAAHLRDLHYCTSTGRFFSFLSADIVTERRSSRAAKQFFCPVCPDSLIKLSKLRCPTCNWSTSSVGISDISGLLQRDGDPYPWISAEIRQLHARFAAQRDPQHSAPEDASAPVAQTAERKSSLPKVQRQEESDQKPPNAGNSSTAAQRFAKWQAEKEKRVFSQWMPEMEMVEWTSLQGRPEGDIDAFMAEEKLDSFLEIEERVCSTTWRKCEVSARRRVPQAKVRIGSPFGSAETKEACQVAPDIAAWIQHACQSAQQGAVSVVIGNKRRRGDLFVTVANADKANERAETMIALGETATLTIGHFSFREEPVPEVLGEFSMCTALAVLEASFQYTEPDITVSSDQESHLRIYARHPR